MQLSTKQLCERLGVTRQRVLGWVSQGLPHEGQGRTLRFAAEAVREWLVAHGIAQVDQPRPCADRLADVAAAFGVSERAVLYWRNAGMPVEADGTYDLGRIGDWRAAKYGRGDESLSPRVQYDTELARIRRDREQIELDRLRGNSIPIEEPSRILDRAIALAAAQLQQIPDVAVAHAGAKATAEERKRLREVMQQQVDRAQTALAQAHEEWAAEIERMFEAQS